MSKLAVRDQRAFYEITKNLQWRLDDGGGGAPPPGNGPEFYRGGGGGALPIWATHMIAFLFGALTFGWLLVAPMLFPAVALAGVIGFLAFAARRRWR